MLRIFTPEKIQRPRPGLNPRTRIPEASLLTTRPPKPLHICVTFYVALPSPIPQTTKSQDETFRDRRLICSNIYRQCSGVLCPFGKWRSIPEVLDHTVVKTSKPANYYNKKSVTSERQHSTMLQRTIVQRMNATGSSFHQ
jgi:hypothetical protein